MASALFNECIELLGNKATILSPEKSEIIFNLFEQVVPIYDGGSRIDWSCVKCKMELNSPDEIISALKTLSSKAIDHSVYVFWNNASLPVLKTNIESVVKYFDDVVSVGFETWLYNPTEGYVIEFYYLGDLHVGLVPSQSASLC